MSDKVRVGVIGCGAGRFHARNYAVIPDVELVALAGLDEDRCREIAGRHDIPRLYRDYTELIAQPDIDGVSVCVPNHLHARMTVFNRRYRNDSHIIKQHVDAGSLGKIYFVRTGWLRDQGIPGGSGGWFTAKTQSGGGCLIDLGVHMLDLALWFVDYPRVESVSASTYAALGPQGRGLFPGRRFRREEIATFDVEDFVMAFLRLETGATMLLEVSWAGYTRKGDRFFTYLWGDKGGAEMDVLDYTTEDTLTLYTDTHGVRTEIRPQTQGEYAKTVNSEFVQAIRLGHAISPTGDEGLHVLRIIEAIYRSAEEGREIIL
jgi:predicted dehydrogenase